MQKKILTWLISMLMLVSYVEWAYAVAPGFYIGLMTGPAGNTSGSEQVLAQDLTTILTANPQSRQYGTRFLLGYKINRYAGIESGIFTFFSSVNYNTPDNTKACGGLSTRTRMFDVVAKGMLPLGDYFDVFGKAGAAVTYISTSGGLRSSVDNGCGKSNHDIKIRPALAVGASYNLSQSWVVDLSWTRFMVGGIINSMNLYALGISYHFVDQYCGQFLCN
jgi:opacity protein-like surface antigen